MRRSSYRHGTRTSRDASRSRSKGPSEVKTFAWLAGGVVALLGISALLKSRNSAQSQATAIQNAQGGAPPAGGIPISTDNLTIGRMFTTAAAGGPGLLAGTYTVLQQPAPGDLTVHAQNLGTQGTEDVPISSITQLLGPA